MPTKRRSRVLALGLGLIVPACAAPPRTTHTSADTGPEARQASAREIDAAVRGWLGADPEVRRVQLDAPSGDLATAPSLNGQSIALEQALYGAITANPDLVALRGNVPATEEAVEVARRFPTTLNPTIFVNPRPGVFEKNVGRSGYHSVQGYFNFSLRQPIELGHQTTHRYGIARAAFEQTKWTILQAEITALVQTYRFFQTSAYRREKLRLAQDLYQFSDRLVTTLRRGLEAKAVAAADLTLAEVEREAVQQLVEAARQDYATALADLRNQIGRPETAATAEPLGDFVLPPFIPEAEDDALIAEAIAGRPDINAARAAAQGSYSAIKLAMGDRIPTIVAGPEYTRDEFGNHFAGFVAIMPLPILNNGNPLVRQREAEYRRSLTVVQQLEQRTTSQVKAATAKWNASNRLVERTNGMTETLIGGVERLERLFQENQTDLTKLLQARQRLIQLENARLDAIWQATQAQADLLTALGAPSLLNALQATVSATPNAAAGPASVLPPPSPVAR